MTKTKKNKMRGGEMTFPSNSNNTVSNTSNNIMNWMSNAWTKTKSESKGLFDKLGEQTKGMMNNTKDFMNKQNSTVAPLNTTETTVVTNPVGGKKKGTKKRRGGYSTRNAAPVQGLLVAKPTYWIKGGKKTRRKRKRSVRRK